MRKPLPFILLGILAVIQLAIPASMILRYENALSEGTPLKFRTGLYDPYDPFRGRYVQLRFELSQINSPEGIELDDGEDDSYYRKPLYVRFAPDENGFATVAAITQNKPDSPGPWLRTNVTNARWSNRHTISITLPFDKYFMNEEAAPEAERIYIEASRRTNPATRADETVWNDGNYALVYVLNGTAAMEALVVNGQPIEELLRQQSTEAVTSDEETSP